MTDYSLSSVMPVPPTRRRWIIPVLIAVAVLVAGSIALVVYLMQPDLADRDPAGARACEMLAAWQRDDITENQLVVSVAVGEQAAKSATESIRKNGGRAFDDDMMRDLRGAGYTADNFRIANLQEVHAACVGEGVNMPPWVDPG